MKIGIDITQTQYPGGVSNLLLTLVDKLIKADQKNDYILFGSSLRNSGKFKEIEAKYSSNKNVKVVIKRLPPTALDTIWNKIHTLPIENFTGPLDIFIASDWTQPPTKKAKKVSIIYDMIAYKYPQETHAKTEFNVKSFLLSPNIVETQKRSHKWLKKEADLVLAISESTKKDAVEILGLDPKKVRVIYPGFSL